MSVGTVYFNCSIGVTGANIAKLTGLVRALKVLGRPYVIIGDFNIEPYAAIKEGIEYYADAKVLLPSNVSYTFNQQSLIDYALVSHQICGLVSLEAATDTPWASHLGLVLGLPTRARKVCARVVSKVRSFPHPAPEELKRYPVGGAAWPI